MLEFLVPSELEEFFYNVRKREEREELEHPYDFLKRIGGNSDLPGFTPPMYVSISSKVAKFTSLITATSILLLVFAIIQEFLYFISSNEFWRDIPYTGWEVYSLGDFTILATPILLSVLFFILSNLVEHTAHNIHYHRIEKPYREEYEEWIESIKPTQVFYPPGLHYELYGDKDFKKNAPKSAPPNLRDERSSEEFLRDAMAIFVIYHIVTFNTTAVEQNREILEKLDEEMN